MDRQQVLTASNVTTTHAQNGKLPVPQVETTALEPIRDAFLELRETIPEGLFTQEAARRIKLQVTTNEHGSKEYKLPEHVNPNSQIFVKENKTISFLQFVLSEGDITRAIALLKAGADPIRTTSGNSCPPILDVLSFKNATLMSEMLNAQLRLMANHARKLGQGHSVELLERAMSQGQPVDSAKQSSMTSSHQYGTD